MDQIEEFTEFFDNFGDLLIDFAFFINATCLPCCRIDEHIVPKNIPSLNLRTRAVSKNIPPSEETELQVITDYWIHKVN